MQHRLLNAKTHKGGQSPALRNGWTVTFQRWDHYIQKNGIEVSIWRQLNTSHKSNTLQPTRPSPSHHARSCCKYFQPSRSSALSVLSATDFISCSFLGCFLATPIQKQNQDKLKANLAISMRKIANQKMPVESPTARVQGDSVTWSSRPNTTKSAPRVIWAITSWT